MIAAFSLLLALIVSCLASDAPCTSQGGTCQDTHIDCPGGYQSGLCSSSASRKCCLHSSHTGSSSSSCSSKGGQCQDDSHKCSGSYVSGACSGGGTNRCCLSHYEIHDKGDCPGLKILSRDSWGARRPRSTSQLHSPVNTFFIHHTESPPCSDESECISKMKSFQNYHMDTHGWSDIGYSFLVGGDGNVYEGRGWTRVGAHTRCHNSDALAASMIGTFTSNLPTAAAQNAVKDLIDCGINKGYISSTYSLHGHRDANPTSCPGDMLYSHLHGMWPSHFHRRTVRFCN